MTLAEARLKPPTQEAEKRSLSERLYFAVLLIQFWADITEQKETLGVKSSHLPDAHNNL